MSRLWERLRGIVGSALAANGPNARYEVDALEPRRLLAGASFGAPVTTALPAGFQFAGMIDAGLANQYIARSASGGGLLLQWQTDETFSVVRQINTSFQIVWFQEGQFYYGANTLIVETTGGVMTEQADGSLSSPSGLAYPADAVSGAWGMMGSDLLVERYTPDAGHPGLGTVTLADFRYDLGTGFAASFEPEVDTVLATNVAAPAPGAPIFAQSSGEAIINGRVWFSNGDGTFRAPTSGPINLPGFSARTRFYDANLVYPYSGGYNNNGMALIAFPVDDGSSPSDAAALLYDARSTGDFQILNTTPLGAAGTTSGVLVRGNWDRTDAVDMATTLLSGPGSPAIEVLGARGDGTFFSPGLFSEPALTPFSIAQDPNGGQPALVGTQSAGQGTVLVSVFDTARNDPVQSVGSSSNPSVIGEPVTLTAIIPGLSDNTVSFFDGSTSLGTAMVQNDGSVTLTVNDFSAGSHSITVVINPGQSYSESSDVFTQVVNAAPSASPYVVVSAFSVDPSVTLSGSITPGTNVNFSMTLKNLGGAECEGNVAVAVIATTAGAADVVTPGAIPIVIPLTVAGLASQDVKLVVGGSVTLTGVWVPPDTMPQRYFVLDAQVTGDAALHLTPALSSAFVIAPSIKIVWGFGGDTPVSSVPFVKDLGGGDVVTFSLTGGGTGVVTPDDPTATLDNGGPDFQVMLYATTKNSDLTITQTGTTRSNIVEIVFSNLSSATPMGTMDLRQDTPHLMQLNDPYGPQDSVGTLMIGPIPEATLRTAPAGTAAAPGNITLSGPVKVFSATTLDQGDVLIEGSDTSTAMAVSIGSIAAGRSFQTTQPISQLQLGSTQPGSDIEAPLVGRLISTGDFDGDLILTQPPSRTTPALGAAQIGGSIAGTAADVAHWWIGGNVGQVRVAGNVTNFELLGGAVPSATGTPGVGTAQYDYMPDTVGLIDVGGFVHLSVVAAGVDPVDGIIGNGNDRVLAGGAIDAIVVGNGVDTASKFVAANLAPIQTPAQAAPNGAHLVWASQPGDFVAGRKMPSAATVELRDGNGNLIVGDHSVATLSIASGPGTGSTVASARFVNGVARFAGISLKAASFYSFEVADGILTPALSNSFTVSPAAPARMHLLDFGPGTTGGYYGDVEILDRYGNRVTADSSTLTFRPIPRSNPIAISIESSVGDGNQVTFDDGVASFFLGVFLDAAPAYGRGLYVDSNPLVRPLPSGPIQA